jgi:GWxTD domain-containing protein
MESGAWSPCSAVDLPALRADHSPLFSADLVISLDSAGRPALSVTLSVPYQELQWVKLPSGYASGAEFTVVFESHGSGRDFGDVWERRIVVPSFEFTASAASTMVEKRIFDVPPGRYEIRIQLRDVNADEASSAREHLDVPDYSRVPVGFADLEVGTADTAGTFTAVPTRRFGLNAARLAARAALFDHRPGSWPRVYAFHYRVLDDGGNEVIAGKRDLTVGHSADPVVVRPDSTTLFIGAYVFEVELVEGRARWRVDRSFEVEESGPPRGREFEKILEPLALIAEPEEVEHLRSLPPEQQAQGWEDFWKRRDPSPDTGRNEAMLEFFRRVRYVEQHFQNFGPGWRSDMGRVYMKFGAADQVENRPATQQTPQLEIWYYNRPYRRFVFADREGFGRFVLVSSALE